MTKKILITGATAGIGLETARTLAEQGHHLLVHGRSGAKVDALVETLGAIQGAGAVEGYVADLSRMADVEALAAAVTEKHDTLDVLINNAGVFKTSAPRTPEGHDLRFVVNTFAPFLLARRLLPLIPADGRILNLSSAAQETVNLDALAGGVKLTDYAAYAQSKAAITAWSRWLADAHPDGPVVVAINPASMLGTNMVREGFGVAGNDVRIGSDILVRAALSDEFASATGKYFDNDARAFGPPHPDAVDPKRIAAIVGGVEAALEGLVGR